MTKENKLNMIKRNGELMRKLMDCISNIAIEQQSEYEKMTKRMNALDEEIIRLNEKLENISDKPKKVDLIQSSENLRSGRLSQFNLTDNIEEVMWGHIAEVLTNIRKEQQARQELDESTLPNHTRVDNGCGNVIEDGRIVQNKIRVFGSTFTSNQPFDKVVVIVKFMNENLRDLSIFTSTNVTPRIDFVFEDIETHGFEFEDIENEHVLKCIFNMSCSGPRMNIMGVKGFSSVKY